MSQNNRRRSPAGGRNFWMFVESAQNLEVLKEMNFTLFAMGPKYRKRAERMKPDDRVLFYVKGLRKWPASATIASKFFEDDSPLWSPTTRNESFRYRIKLRADIVLDEEDYIDARLLAPQLEYIKRWMPEDWPLAFWDRLHLLPQRDFKLIEGEMQRIASGREPVLTDDQRDGGPSPADGAGRTQADRGHRQEPSGRVDADEPEPEVVSYPPARPAKRQAEPGRPSGQVDDDEGEPEVVSYPPAQPDEREGEPERPSGQVDDNEGEPEVVSYPPARPAKRQAEPGRPSGQVDDDEDEPEVVSSPPAQPDEPQAEPDSPSGRVDDDKAEPEVDSAPPARPDERQPEPDRPSGQVDDDEEGESEPEVVSSPPARPDERQPQPDRPSGRTDDDEGEGEPDRPSGQVDDDEGEPEVVSDRAARPDERQGRPGYPAARPAARKGDPYRLYRRVDDDEGEDAPEIIGYPPGESVEDGTEQA